MAKVITQETFDEVVKENIVDFSMNSSEAKEETVKQFEAQGVNLANIIKDLSINENTGEPHLNESIDKLKAHATDEKKIIENSDLIKQLNIVENECKKSIPHRVLAAKLEGHRTILLIIEQELSKSSIDLQILEAALNAENTISNKQPDIFDDETLNLILKIIDNQKVNSIITSLALQWLAKVCLMHEINRQNIINADIIKAIHPLINVRDNQVIRDVCTLMRFLILDDDVRVEFGKAHEHARLLATTVLIDLTNLLTEFDDVLVLSDLLVTIASLVVRQEFCLAVAESNGLEHVLKLMIQYPNAVKLNREALKLLRSLAGHDQVKIQIVKKGAAPLIHNILLIHKSDEALAAAALVCISTLTLRVKDNSVAFFEVGIPQIIVETMQLHPGNKIVQRNAAWAIRNMVARAREHCESFLSIGAEDLLNKAMNDHSGVQQDIKAALRDLGCKVELKEEWTGKSEIKMSN